MAVDLHVHSNVSDGVYSPRELVLMAKAKGLKAFALTDHDLSLIHILTASLIFLLLL